MARKSMAENARSAKPKGKGRAVAHRPKTQAVTVIEQPATSMLQVIERAARDPSVDVGKMSALLDLQERISDSEKRAEFARSMTAAQAALKAVRKDRENQSTGSAFASYEALDREVRPVIEQHGFSMAFNTADAPAADIPMVRVVCRVTHVNGYFVDYKIDLPADGKGAKGGDVMTRTHAVGSAMTYARRYLVKMIWNIVDSELVDDDGNAAGTAYITEREAADLRALATEIGVNIPAYLKAMRIETFEKCPVSRYKDALATLEAKRRGAA